MLKRLILFATCFTFLLMFTACSTSEDKQSTDNDSSKEVVEEQDEMEAQDSNATSETTINDKESKIEKEPASEDQKETKYEEETIINEQINTDGLSIENEVDSDHKRILLFKDDNNKPQYKSIYIKNEKRLKIIDTTKDNGLIYNEIIE